MQPDAGLDAPRPPPQTPRHVHKNELTLCGLAAVQARWQRDPAAIKRLFFDEATGRRIGTICRALAASRRVYRCVPAAELEKVAGSMHHGGIVAIVDAPELQAPPARELAAWAGSAGPLPSDAATRSATIQAVGRGLAELQDLFNTVRWR